MSVNLNCFMYFVFLCLGVGPHIYCEVCKYIRTTSSENLEVLKKPPLKSVSSWPYSFQGRGWDRGGWCDRPRQQNPRGGKLGSRLDTLNEKKNRLSVCVRNKF